MTHNVFASCQNFSEYHSRLLWNLRYHHHWRFSLLFTQWITGKKYDRAQKTSLCLQRHFAEHRYSTEVHQFANCMLASRIGCVWTPASVIQWTEACWCYSYTMFDIACHSAHGSAYNGKVNSCGFCVEVLHDFLLLNKFKIFIHLSYIRDEYVGKTTDFVTNCSLEHLHL